MSSDDTVEGPRAPAVNKGMHAAVDKRMHAAVTKRMHAAVNKRMHGSNKLQKNARQRL